MPGTTRNQQDKYNFDKEVLPKTSFLAFSFYASCSCSWLTTMLLSLRLSFNRPAFSLCTFEKNASFDKQYSSSERRHEIFARMIFRNKLLHVK